MSGNEVPDSGYQLLLDTAFIIPSTAAKYAHILNTAYYILHTILDPIEHFVSQAQMIRTSIVKD